MIQDIRGLQDQLAFPDSQVSKVPKAEREALDFQVSQAHLAIPVKGVPLGYQGNRDSPGLQAVQVPPVGKDSQGKWGLLAQVE